MDIEIQNNIKKRRLTSEDIITTSIQSPHWKNYTLFSSKFNNFSFDYLVDVNLSDSGIIYLPKQFGTLPIIQDLNLSRNCLGAYNRYRWLWIEQFAIGKSLRSLDISYNSLKELPLCIDKLHALEQLNISNNILRRLSQRIGNLSNLKSFDFSYNRLSYLPSTFLKLIHITHNSVDATNPLLYSRDIHEHHIMNMDNLKYQIMDMFNNTHEAQFHIPSLKELSANIIREHRIKYNINSIPPSLVIYLDAAESCDICKRICIEQYCFKINYFIYNIMMHRMLGLEYNLLCASRRGEEDSVYAQLRIYRCLSCCVEYPVLHMDDVLNAILWT